MKLYIMLLLVQTLAFPIYAKDACKDVLSSKKGKKSFSILDQGEHDSRIIAEQMDFKDIRHDLMQISGVIPLDCQGNKDCIADRYTPENKKLFRKFLAKRFKQLGLEPRVESYEREFKTYVSTGSGGSSTYTYIQRIIPEEITREEASAIYSSAGFRDLKRYLVEIKDMKDSIDLVTDVADLEVLEELKEELEEVRKKTFVLDGVPIGSAIVDVNNMIRKIEAGIKYKAEQEEKAEEEKKEATKKPEKKKVKLEENEGENFANNVIVVIEGTDFPNEVVEISTHYDSYGLNIGGADDNGSGIVTALEMIRLFQIYKPRRTLRFVFTDLEEKDGRGAEGHAEKIAKSKSDEKFIGALVIDMFGYAKLGKNPKFVAEIGTSKDYDSEKAFRKGLKLGETLAYQYKKYTDRQFTYENLFHNASPSTGDHGAYWDEDLPAIFIAQPEFEANPANHSSTDKIENMNWGFFMEVAKLITETTATLVGSSIDNSVLSESRKKYLERVIDKDVSPKVSRLKVVEKPTYTPPKTGGYKSYTPPSTGAGPRPAAPYKGAKLSGVSHSKPNPIGFVRDTPDYKPDPSKGSFFPPKKEDKDKKDKKKDNDKKPQKGVNQQETPASDTGKKDKPVQNKGDVKKKVTEEAPPEKEAKKESPAKGNSSGGGQGKDSKKEELGFFGEIIKGWFGI